MFVLGQFIIFLVLNVSKTDSIHVKSHSKIINGINLWVDKRALIIFYNFLWLKNISAFSFICWFRSLSRKTRALAKHWARQMQLSMTPQEYFTESLQSEFWMKYLNVFVTLSISKRALTDKIFWLKGKKGSQWYQSVSDMFTITHRETEGTFGVLLSSVISRGMVAQKTPAATPFKEKWNRTGLLFKLLTIKKKKKPWRTSDRVSGLYLADSVKSQRIHRARLKLSGAVCKNYCAAGREPQTCLWGTLLFFFL